jgi:broad specificity phosphatase PhoE
MGPADPVRPTRISFVRHGEVFNPKRIVYGRLPRFHLSVKGLEEARATGRRLSASPIAAVFTSPMLRARQTAKLVTSSHRNIPISISTLLIEVCSPFQGRPNAEADRVKWNLFDGADCQFEQPADIVRRVRRFIDRTRRRLSGQHSVAVTHGDVVAFTILWAKGVDLHPDRRLDLRDHGFPDRYPSTGSVTTLIFGRSSGDRPVGMDYWRPP